MVDNSMLCYIHCRLQQIKGVHDKPFGNVSVLAVGDFYQLPPVRGKPLFDIDEGELVNLWSLFCKWELCEVMRQKSDLPFTHLLNRIRVLGKHETLPSTDQALLQSRLVSFTTKYPNDALHIFSRNVDVDNHNIKMLNSACSNIFTVSAADIQYDEAGNQRKYKHPIQSAQGVSLPSQLTLAVGARVMLTTNLDVQDGLVNGVCGTISEIASFDKTMNLPKAIYITFDSEQVGKSRYQSQIVPTQINNNAVIIKPHTEKFIFQSKTVTRHQYPLKLAWAVTIDKVQGQTTDTAVISLDNVFQSGMAYVALSRVTKLEGLHLLSCNEKAFYSNSKIAPALQKMPSIDLSNACPLSECYSNPIQNQITIVHHNIQSMSAHFQDLARDHEFQFADILCLSETWLQYGHHILTGESFHLEGYKCIPFLSRRRAGGVAVYVRNTFQPQHLEIQTTACDALPIKINCFNKTILLIAVYRSPTIPVHELVQDLINIKQQLQHNHCTYTIFVGDFNHDLTRKQPLEPLQSFFQLVKKPTTFQNTLIDHFYILPQSPTYRVGTFSTHYSYHHAIYVSLS
ncbi:ATP-dependent DNA helicase PIF1 [Holothuria leucospilota]|uniref:ATP-dependent DNA helicase PIF1 n=1 Tax=Holothuria leucospilota TaxID=206669 RepID=A0A9Q1BUP2_HOLLE|nr:ATP-dependent DNA helicase PIF1 [Holothuria leucospilota]